MVILLCKCVLATTSSKAILSIISNSLSYTLSILETYHPGYPAIHHIASGSLEKIKCLTMHIAIS